MKHEQNFAHFSDFVALASQDVRSNLSRASRNNYGGGASWSGTNSFEEALELASRGWSEGLHMVGRLGVSMFDVLGSRRDGMKTRHDTAGAWVDIGSFCMGEPEHMIDFEPVREATHGPIVRIVVSGIASSMVNASTITRRGSAVMALIDCLENAGRSIELILNLHSGHADKLETVITLKAPGVSLSPEQLAFALCHPSTLRRLWFGVAETLPDEARKAGGFHDADNYGRCTEATDQGDIYLPMLTYNQGFDSERNALKWVKDNLITQGVALEERNA